ncbi:MAG: DNA-directed RNA polymerase, partial [Nanoarchaeota archaeon]
MFYLIDIEDYVRVEPRLFGLETLEAVRKQLEETYADYISREIGVVISIVDVLEVGEGIVIPGDGAAYYKSRFKILTWKPEMHELVYGSIAEITNFGAFINLGMIQGMIHISQTMEDYVSFSKSNVLIGKASKRSLRKGDLCLARIVAISQKSGELKIGLTMRQPGLGRLDWISEEKKKARRIAKQAE